MAVKTSHMERNYVPVTLCISIGLCSGNMQFSTSLSSETTRPILMKLETYNYRPRTTHHDKRHFDVTTWVVSANSRLPTVMFLSLSFFFWSLRHALRSHWWTDFDDLWVKRRLSAQECASRSFVDIAPPFWGAWVGVFKPNVQHIKTSILLILWKLLHQFQPNFAQR